MNEGGEKGKVRRRRRNKGTKMVMLAGWYIYCTLHLIPPRVYLIIAIRTETPNQNVMNRVSAVWLPSSVRTQRLKLAQSRSDGNRDASSWVSRRPCYSLSITGARLQNTATDCHRAAIPVSISRYRQIPGDRHERLSVSLPCQDVIQRNYCLESRANNPGPLKRSRVLKLLPYYIDTTLKK